MNSRLGLLILAVLSSHFTPSFAAQSVARIWDERALAAIRQDTPHPPAQARNYFSLSVCMYDAWAAYDTNGAVGYVYRGKHTAPDIAATVYQCTGECWNMTKHHAFALLATVAASGCTVTTRIDANFNADPQLAPPTAPLPLPPDDSLNWRTEFVTATGVAGAAGGKRIRIAPRQGFIAAPDFRRVFLVAVSEAFTTRPAANMRGSIRLRIIGLGTVGVALRPVQGEQRLDYIGGFALSNFLPPAGASVEPPGTRRRSACQLTKQPAGPFPSGRGRGCACTARSWDPSRSA